MRDGDLRLLAKKFVENMVYLKTTNDSKLKTLNEWYDDAKMNQFVMNEIMFKLKNKSLPSKTLDYKKYFEHEWLAMKVEFGFIKKVIANLRAKIAN